MTNEEKAIEIGKRHKIEYISGLKNDLCGTSFIECVCSAKEMAKWKDHQFKEYLEKKRADIKIELRKNMSDAVNHSFSRVELALIDEIINELFGGEETDNKDREE